MQNVIERQGTPDLSIDRPVALGALALCGAVPQAMYMVLPAFVGELHNIVPAMPGWQIGLLASADLAGIAISAATGERWVRKVRWPVVIRQCLITYLLANVLSLATEQFWPLLILRLVAGLSGGAAYAIALAGISDTKNPARVAAFMVSAQIIVGSVGIYAVPYISVGPSINSVYIYIILWTVPLIALCWRSFPNDPGTRPKFAPTSAGKINRAARVTVIAATASFALCIGAVWAMLETMAINFGLLPRDVSAAISIGFIASLLGSGLAAWQGVRFGRMLPLVFGLVLLSATLIVMADLSSFTSPNTVFFLASSLFQIVWSYGLSYQIVIFNDADPSGRFLAYYGTTYYGGMALGPLAAASLVSAGDYSPLMISGLVVLTVSYGLYMMSVYFVRRPS